MQFKAFTDVKWSWVSPIGTDPAYLMGEFNGVTFRLSHEEALALSDEIRRKLAPVSADPLSVEDARELLASLEEGASPEEMARRAERARARLAAVTAPKGYPPRPPASIPSSESVYTDQCGGNDR